MKTTNVVPGVRVEPKYASLREYWGPGVIESHDETTGLINVRHDNGKSDSGGGGLARWYAASLRTNKTAPPTAIGKMRAKVADGTSRGMRGYVTNLAEVAEIMKELTPLVPVNIWYSEPNHPIYGKDSFEIKFSFLLDPEVKP